LQRKLSNNFREFGFPVTASPPRLPALAAG